MDPEISSRCGTPHPTRSIYKRLKDTVLKNFTAEERYNMDKDTFTKFVQEAVEKGIITKKEGKQIIQSRSFQ